MFSRPATQAQQTLPQYRSWNSRANQRWRRRQRRNVLSTIERALTNGHPPQSRPAPAPCIFQRLQPANISGGKRIERENSLGVMIEHALIVVSLVVSDPPRSMTPPNAARRDR